MYTLIATIAWWTLDIEFDLNSNPIPLNIVIQYHSYRARERDACAARAVIPREVPTYMKINLSAHMPLPSWKQVRLTLSIVVPRHSCRKLVALRKAARSRSIIMLSERPSGHRHTSKCATKNRTLRAKTRERAQLYEMLCAVQKLKGAARKQKRQRRVRKEKLKPLLNSIYFTSLWWGEV